jgi:ComF family protein
VCACCDLPLDDTLDGCVCAHCWNSIPPPSLPICDVCGDALPSWRAEADTRCTRCRRRPRVITRGRSIASYEGTLRDVLHSLKYDGRRSIAKGIGERMAQSGAEVLDGADALVPVPLHWIRQYRRGYNQAEELARCIGLPVVDALRRSRRTVTQTDLPEAQRLANVSGAFRLRRSVRITGQVLVLVDDVSTTGATLDACARVLLDGGAAEVRALTAARAAARLP